MRLVTFWDGNGLKIGAVKQGWVVDLSAVAGDMQTFIEGAPATLAVAGQLVSQAKEGLALDEVTLAAPLPQPRRNIMCLGMNYAAHAAESAAAAGRETRLPETPVVFTKAPTAVIGHDVDIPFHASATTEMDWEVELAVIIGRQGRNMAADAAMDHVFGYTVLNDVTARDLQRRGKQYFKGKSLDGFCPIGPWIVTADEIPAPHNLRLTSSVNGRTMQDSHTSDMIFRIPEIISYLSQGMALLPGDIIATGTPSGVGFARQPPIFLQPGDEVVCDVEGIGQLRNVVAAGDGGVG
ncbi:MAG: fumarylacetoacetate hydrolase family protein [Candidatus Promineifilaceae bacterium]|nr:fumarylacetoacetate hydrolase family protein [Candidatus Promineifilaceae bacterium]